MSDSSSDDKASSSFQSLFDLPSDELLVDTFHCALQRGILHQGKLFVSQHFLAFHARIPFSETKLLLRADHIRALHLARVLIFPTALRVEMQNGAEYLFASFLKRDACHKLLQRVMRGERVGKQRVKSAWELDQLTRTHSLALASEGSAAPSAALEPPTKHQLLLQRANRRNQDKEGAADEEERPSRSTRASKETQQQEEEELQRPDDDDDGVPAAFLRPKRRTPRSSFDDTEPATASSAEQADEPPRSAAKSSSRRCTGEMSQQPNLLQVPSALPRGAPTTPGSAPAPRSRGEEEAAGASNGRSHPQSARSMRSKQRDEPSPDSAPIPQRSRTPSRRSSREPSETRPAPIDTSDASAEGESAAGASTAASPASPDSPESPDSEFARGSTTLFDPVRSYKVADPRVTAIAARFRPPLTSFNVRHRRLLFQGFVRRQGGFSAVDRWALLFTDRLLFAKQIEGRHAGEPTQYELKQVIDLSRVVLDTRPVELQRANEPDAQGSAFDLIRSTKLPNPFRLIVLPLLACGPLSAPSCDSSGPDGITYVLSCSTRAERSRWVEWILFGAARLLRAQDHSRAQGGYGWWLALERGSAHRAAWEDDVPLLRALLAAEPELRDSSQDFIDGATPLHLSARAARLAATRELLEQGADVSLRDRNNLTPLHLAASGGHANVLAELLTAAMRDGFDYTLLHPALSKRQSSKHAMVGVVRDLAGLSAFWQCVLSAPLASWESTLRVLLQIAGNDRDPATITPLQRALLDDRNSHGWTLLEALLRAGEAHARRIPALVAFGANVEANTSEGITPLALAVRLNSLSLVEALLHAGAQPNLRRGSDMRAAGHFAPRDAVESDSELHAVALCLIAHGARYRMASSNGSRLADLFGADRDEDDETPAMRAMVEALDAADEDRPILLCSTPARIGAPNATETNCAICLDAFEKRASGPLKSTRRRERVLCALCGLTLCSACTTRRLAFPRDEADPVPRPVQLPSHSAAGGLGAFAPPPAHDEKHTVKRVCDGCYNRLHWRTARNRRERRRARRAKRKARKAARESGEHVSSSSSGSDAEGDVYRGVEAQEDQAGGLGVAGQLVQKAAVTATSTLLSLVGRNTSRHAAPEGASVDESVGGAIAKLGSLLTSVRVEAGPSRPAAEARGGQASAGKQPPAILDGPAAAIRAGTSADPLAQINARSRRSAGGASGASSSNPNLAVPSSQRSSANSSAQSSPERPARSLASRREREREREREGEWEEPPASAISKKKKRDKKRSDDE